MRKMVKQLLKFFRENPDFDMDELPKSAWRGEQGGCRIG
jgi:hypothetical protein